MFTFYILFNLFLNWFERVCKYTKIKETWWTWQVISIIAKNKLHNHHKTYWHTMKVYNIQPVSLIINVWLIKIVLFFDHWSNHLFQSNQHFQVIEFVNRPVQEKLDISHRFLCIAFVMMQFLSPVSTVSARNARDQSKASETNDKMQLHTFISKLLVIVALWH